MYTKLVRLFIMWVLVASPIAYADSPTVTSFSVTPSSISNDYSVSLTWSVSNGDAHELYFVCPQGVTLKLNGSAFPCDTRRAASSNASDSIGIKVLNVSGTTKTVSVSVYPKSGGVANDAGAQSQTFTVSSAAQPITDFSASTAVVESTTPVSFSWSGVYAPAANLQIDCVSGLTAYSGSSANGTALPCGSPAFASDLAISGSQTLTFVNTTAAQVAAVVRVIPAITSGLYDTTHGLVASVAVNPQQLGSTVTVTKPLVTSFTASTDSTLSGVPFTVGWSTKDASSTNMQYACSDSLTLAVIDTSFATTTLRCGSPAFDTALTESASSTLMAINKSFITQNLSILLLPMDGAGIYQLSGAKTLVIPVRYQSLSPVPGVVVPASNAATTSTTSQTSNVTSQNNSSTGAKGLSHVPFFKLLSRGSKGAEVVALQLFLGLNHDIYPENSASGTFGPATQRAVQRFQDKYGIVKKGEQGYGSVGPKTRAKLNALTLP